MDAKSVAKYVAKKKKAIVTYWITMASVFYL